MAETMSGDGKNREMLLQGNKVSVMQMSKFWRSNIQEYEYS